MIKFDLVYTLRDLRDERPPVVRTILWAYRSGRDGYVGFQLLEAEILLELALVALEWRKDDRHDVPKGEHAPPTGDVLTLIKSVGEILAGNGSNYSLYGADCTLVLTREPTP